MISCAIAFVGFIKIYNNMRNCSSIHNTYYNIGIYYNLHTMQWAPHTYGSRKDR